MDFLGAPNYLELTPAPNPGSGEIWEPFSHVIEFDAKNVLLRVSECNIGVIGHLSASKSSMEFRKDIHGRHTQHWRRLVDRQGKPILDDGQPVEMFVAADIEIELTCDECLFSYNENLRLAGEVGGLSLNGFWAARETRCHAHRGKWPRFQFWYRLALIHR